MKKNLFIEILRDTAFPYSSSQFTEETAHQVKGCLCNDPVILLSFADSRESLACTQGSHIKGSQCRTITEKEKPATAQRPLVEERTNDSVYLKVGNQATMKMSEVGGWRAEQWRE